MAERSPLEHGNTMTEIELRKSTEDVSGGGRSDDCADLERSLMTVSDDSILFISYQPITASFSRPPLQRMCFVGSLVYFVLAVFELSTMSE